MSAKTREELQAEYAQYSPTGLKNLDAIIRSDIATCDESIQDAPTTECVIRQDYWRACQNICRLFSWL